MCYLFTSFLPYLYLLTPFVHSLFRSSLGSLLGLGNVFAIRLFCCGTTVDLIAVGTQIHLWLLDEERALGAVDP